MQQVQNALFTYLVNGKPVPVVLPDYNVAGVFTKVNPSDYSQYDPSLIAQVQQPSGYIIDDKGDFRTQTGADQEALHEAAVKAGTERKVPVGNGFGYIPVGSAADIALQNPASLNTATPAGQYGQTTLNNGKIINASGITPPTGPTGVMTTLGGADLNQGGSLGIGTRPSPTNPGVTEYYDTQTGQGYPNQQALFQAIYNKTGQQVQNFDQVNSLLQNQGQGSGSNPDLGPYADLYKQMQNYISQLQANGKTINPNVQITPDQLASFAAQAATEIHPYYATQLQAATDSFLSGLGYNTQQFNNQIQQAQTTYGRNLDTLASNSADQGFAQSGIRQKQEGQLANDTQNNLDQLRSSLFNTSQNAARSFAQTYGGSQVPGAPQLAYAPLVLSGQSQFDTSGGQQGLYQLDPSIYNRLIGSEQNSEKQATDSAASKLASNYIQGQTNNQVRSLNTPIT